MMVKPQLSKVGNIAKLDTRNEYEKGIANMREIMPYAIQEWEIKSGFLKVKYDQLIKDGFTEIQAMDIIKTRPLFE